MAAGTDAGVADFRLFPLGWLLCRLFRLSETALVEVGAPGWGLGYRWSATCWSACLSLLA